MASGGLHMDIDGDNSSEPTSGKSSRFHIFKSIRRYISKKRNKRKDEVMVVSVKSKSTSDMLEAQDCETWKQRGISVPHNAGLSMSHDSIFTPDIHGTTDDGDRRMQETALSLHDIRDELFMKINMRQGSDDDDIGFPHSPHTLPTTADILEQGLKDPQLAKSHSTCSDASLLSMSSSELDEEPSNLSPSQQSSKLSLFTEPQNDGDDVLEAIPLQHDAAHHRIAVKPRNRRKSVGNRRLQKQNSGNLPVTPEVNEELLKNVTENHQETSISLELRDDSALTSDDGLSPTSTSSYSESFEKVMILNDDTSPLQVSQPQISEIPKKKLNQKLSLEIKFQNFLPYIDKTTEKSNLSSNDSLDFENNSQIVMRTSWQNLTAPREKDIANLETRKNQSFPHGQKPHYAEEIQSSNESSKKEENKITKIWRKYNKKPDGETNSNKDKSTKNIFSRIFSKNSFRKPKKTISDNSDQNLEISHSKSDTNIKVFYKSNSQRGEEIFTQCYPAMPVTKGFSQKSVIDVEKELSKENAKKSKVVKRSISVKKDDIFYRKKNSDANKNASIKSAPEFVNEKYSPRARLNSSTWKEMKCEDNKIDDEGELYKVFARRSMKLKELELLESGESINSGDTGKTTNPLFEDDAKLLDKEKANSVLNRVSLFEKTASHWDERHSVSNSRTVASHYNECHLMSNNRTISISEDDEHHSLSKRRTVNVSPENERHSSTKSKIISLSQDDKHHSISKIRTGSVSQDDEYHSISKSRTGSVSQDDEYHSISKSRTGSASQDDEYHSINKSRTGSASQDDEYHSINKSRTSSVSQDDQHHSINKSRTGSASQDDEYHSINKSRTGSVSQDDQHHSINKSRTGSVSQDDEYHSINKSRTSSVSQDDQHHSINKSRTSSASQDDEYHSITKSRTGSASQDDERHSISKTRTGSVLQDDEYHSITKSRTGSVSQNDELHSLNKNRTVSVSQDNEKNYITKNRNISPSQNDERHSMSKTRTVSVSQDDEYHSLNKNRTVSVSQDDEHNPINTSKTVSALLGDEYYSTNNRTVIEFSNVSNNILSQENKNSKEKPDIITFINHKLKQIEKNRPVANVPTLENPYPTWVRVAKQKQKQREEHVEKLEKEIQNKQSNLQKYEEGHKKKLQTEAKELRSEKTKLTEESFLIEKLRPWEPKATEYIIQGSPLEVGLPNANAFKPWQSSDKSRHHHSFPHRSGGSSSHQSRYAAPDIDFIDTYYKYKVYQV